MGEIPEAHIKSVFFLCIDKRGDGGVVKREPAATGFFVKVPLRVGAATIRVEYLVTARHCIDEARRDAVDDKLYVRFNLKSGTFTEIETNIDDWVSHLRADVAAIRTGNTKQPVGFRPEDVDAGALSIEHFLGPGPNYDFVGKVRELGDEPVRIAPTVGHEIYFPGLFSQHYGRERNLPIARFGQISRMPTEIELTHGGVHTTVVAYLCEFRSIGGHSGSPVFFSHPMTLLTERVDDRGVVTGARTDTARVFGLMGLVSGHYDLPEKAEVTGELGEVQVRMNSGIAIVTPAEAVRQLLMEQEEFVAEREKLKKDIEAKIPVPTLDFTGREDDLSQGGFEDALKKVNRRVRPSEPDSTSSET
ncbi:MAG: hypothetical protein IH959_03865 [Chloroflexi bacterium]|nr:hypothetical protein [Chloroflexota bacterium]